MTDDVLNKAIELKELIRKMDFFINNVNMSRYQFGFKNKVLSVFRKDHTIDPMMLEGMREWQKAELWGLLVNQRAALQKEYDELNAPVKKEI